MDERRFDDPIVIAVAKQLCYGPENQTVANTWWPKLPYSYQNEYLRRAVIIVELVEKTTKKPKMKWRNS